MASADMQTDKINDSETEKEPTIGLALSGGGSRAIAFHLGCLRVLHKCGILQKINYISAVSGGSIIGAMWAYSSDEFEAFDERVVRLLKKGLTGSILKEWLLPPRCIPELFCLLFNLVGKLSFGGIDKLLSAIFRRKIYISQCRPISRTTAFRAALRKRLFGRKKLTSVTREGLKIVINACELQTGSGFRFGSKESGCYRREFGRIKCNDVEIADAVTASAAYPVLLPTLNPTFTFIQDDKEVRKRVFLTDGGVYENLGISCFDPRRPPNLCFNVFTPDYIICCSAGHGLFDADYMPSWWPARMVRAFQTVFRKNQDKGYGWLFSLRRNEEIRDFVLPYLGQQDHRIPEEAKPEDFVPREDVYKYPTDFSAMKDGDLYKITKRGEQLTQISLDTYLPSLCEKHPGEEETRDPREVPQRRQ